MSGEHLKVRSMIDKTDAERLDVLNVMIEDEFRVVSSALLNGERSASTRRLRVLVAGKEAIKRGASREIGSKPGQKTASWIEGDQAILRSSFLSCL